MANRKNCDAAREVEIIVTDDPEHSRAAMTDRRLRKDVWTTVDGLLGMPAGIVACIEMGGGVASATAADERDADSDRRAAHHGAPHTPNDTTGLMVVG